MRVELARIQLRRGRRVCPPATLVPAFALAELSCGEMCFPEIGGPWHLPEALGTAGSATLTALQLRKRGT